MFERNCPECNKLITYSVKKSFKNAERKKSLCKKCAAKNKDKSFYKQVSLKLKGKPKTKEHKEKLRQANLGKKLTESHKKNISKGLKTGGNVNKISNYDCWVKKYGEKKAQELLQQSSLKKSKASSGKNNPMYGKPSPQGSGNGWSGWYKDFFFRSLLELSFLKYIFDNDIKIISAETKEFSVEYYDEQEHKFRNYFPDFYLIDSDEIIEIKPKRTIKYLRNKLKIDAATKKYGNKFKVLCEDNYPQLSFEEIKQMYDNKDIIFIDRYDKKMKEKINETS